MVIPTQKNSLCREQLTFGGVNQRCELYCVCWGQRFRTENTSLIPEWNDHCHPHAWNTHKIRAISGGTQQPPAPFKQTMTPTASKSGDCPTWKFITPHPTPSRLTVLIQNVGSRIGAEEADLKTERGRPGPWASADPFLQGRIKGSAGLQYRSCAGNSICFVWISVSWMSIDSVQWHVQPGVLWRTMYMWVEVMSQDQTQISSRHRQRIVGLFHLIHSLASFLSFLWGDTIFAFHLAFLQCYLINKEVALNLYQSPPLSTPWQMTDQVAVYKVKESVKLFMLFDQDESLLPALKIWEICLPT